MTGRRRRATVEGAAGLAAALLAAGCGQAGSDVAEAPAADVAPARLVPASAGKAAPAQSRLPLPEGVYVDVAKPCGASSRIWFHLRGQIGDMSFFGPNGSMGPDFDGVERIDSVAMKPGGFYSINDGPGEVRSDGEGRMTMRVMSRADGELGERQRFRRCEIASLHPRMRAALDRLGYGTDAAAAPAGAAALPFREGRYGTGEPFPVEGGGGGLFYSTSFVIRGDEFLRLAEPDEEECRILDRSVSGDTARLTFQCMMYCGNGADYCGRHYAPERKVVVIRALDRNRVAVSYPQWPKGDGVYVYVDDGR